MTNLYPDYRLHDYEINRLLSLCGTLNGLTAVHQKLVAEIALLRLFSLFENFVSSVAAKLACGATYLDGTVPLLSVRANSSEKARKLFKEHARAKPLYQLKWTTAEEIKGCVKYVIDKSEAIVCVIDRNGTHIDELRRVRNRIAHNNGQSRKNYSLVVMRHYGACMNNVTPGMLLLTSRKHPMLIEQYIRKQRILAKEIVKA